jgi:hypothetical protein
VFFFSDDLLNRTHYAAQAALLGIIAIAFPGEAAVLTNLTGQNDPAQSQPYLANCAQTFPGGQFGLMRDGISSR